MELSIARAVTISVIFTLVKGQLYYQGQYDLATCSLAGTWKCGGVPPTTAGVTMLNRMLKEYGSVEYGDTFYASFSHCNVIVKRLSPLETPVRVSKPDANTDLYQSYPCPAGTIKHAIRQCRYTLCVTPPKDIHTFTPMMLNGMYYQHLYSELMLPSGQIYKGKGMVLPIDFKGKWSLSPITNMSWIMPEAGRQILMYNGSETAPKFLTFLTQEIENLGLKVGDTYATSIRYPELKSATFDELEERVRKLIIFKEIKRQVAEGLQAEALRVIQNNVMSNINNDTGLRYARNLGQELAETTGEQDPSMTAKKLTEQFQTSWVKIAAGVGVAFIILIIICVIICAFACRNKITNNLGPKNTHQSIMMNA